MAKTAEKTPVEYVNPDSMHKNPAFSQAVVVSSGAKTIYIGGQNAVDGKGNIVGKGDLKAQTEQVFKNLKTVLKEAGADLTNVVKWNLYVVKGTDLREGLAVYQQEWGKNPNPPAITMNFVEALANPDFMVEMDAIAVVPE